MTKLAIFKYIQSSPYNLYYYKIDDKSRNIYFLTKRCLRNLYIIIYILSFKIMIDYKSSIVFKH